MYTQYLDLLQKTEYSRPLSRCPVELGQPWQPPESSGHCRLEFGRTLRVLGELARVQRDENTS
jgi:hypothetical protein